MVDLAPTFDVDLCELLVPAINAIDRRNDDGLYALAGLLYRRPKLPAGVLAAADEKLVHVLPRWVVEEPESRFLVDVRDGVAARQTSVTAGG
jgi:hypothetical protein